MSTGGSAPSTRSRAAQLGAALTTNFVIPASIVVAVTSVLFVVIATRAVLVAEGGLALAWTGTCLALAAVVIVRFGRVGRDRDRQAVYVILLTCAVVLNVWFLSTKVGSYVTGAAATTALASNAAITMGVLWLASALTRQLSFEEPLDPRNAPLYGDGYRLWQASLVVTDDPDAAPPAPRTEPRATRRARKAAASPWVAFAWRIVTAGAHRDPRQNPARGVARMVVAALVIFAACEPVLLAGPPEHGTHALLAMLAFLVASSVLLAAGSISASMLEAESRGAEPSVALIPSRIAIGAAMVVALAALALAVPGMRWAGTGALRPPATASTGRASAEHERATRAQSEHDSDSSGTAAAAIARLAVSIGRIVVLVAAVVFVVWAVRFLPRVISAWSAWRPHVNIGAVRALGDWLSRLLGGKRRAARGIARSPAADPWSGIDELAGLPPEDAVRAAYGRLVVFCDERDAGREPADTPHEILALAPLTDVRARDAAHSLTMLYVDAAYGPRRPTEHDRDLAIGALRVLSVTTRRGRRR